MKITNNYLLPEPIINAMKGREAAYQGSHERESNISVTELISPPQLAYLKRLYDDQLEQDASEMAFALLGSAVHAILEDNGAEGDVIEQRYYNEAGGWVISGMVDRYVPSAALIQDYKVMSVWEHILGLSAEKKLQLNVLSWLVQACDGRRDDMQLEIVAIFRDWQKSKAEFDSSYPNAPIMTIPVDHMSMGEIEDYIARQVEDHQKARAGDPRPCTDDERWYTGDKYAVMKGKNKRATKLFDSSKAAFGMANGDSQLWVQKRPGLSRRCADYCPVGKAGLCPQWEQEAQ